MVLSFRIDAILNLSIGQIECTTFILWSIFSKEFMKDIPLLTNEREIMGCLFYICGWVYMCIIWYSVVRYNAVNFLSNPHKVHPIAHPLVGLYTFKSIRYDMYRIVFGSIQDTYHDTYR